MFTKNRKNLLLLMICTCLALVACSSKTSDSQNDTIEDNMGLNILIGERKSEKMPDNYPSQLFPIYEGSYIFNAVEYEGSFNIATFTKDDYEDIAGFYKDFLKATETTYEVDDDTGYSRCGIIDGFIYTFSTNVSDDLRGYDSSILIMLMPTP